MSRNNKNNVHPCKPPVLLHKSWVYGKGVNIIQACFRDGKQYLADIFCRFLQGALKNYSVLAKLTVYTLIYASHRPLLRPAPYLHINDRIFIYLCEKLLFFQHYMFCLAFSQ